MKIFEGRGEHCTDTFDFFDFARLDPFYDQNVLSALFGQNWNSILIVGENKNAFLNVFVKNEIEGTEYFDIEPYFGYSGPVTNSDDQDFVNAALEVYSEHQKGQNVVAEFFRFNPMHENQKLFENSKVRVFGTKKIVIADCHKNEDEQFVEYSKTRRNIIRRAKDSFEFKELSSEEDINTFIGMYNNTMDRVAAEKKWYFDSDFYKKMNASDNFKFYAAIYEGKIASAIIIIEHEFMNYYYLSANSGEFIRGSSEFAIHTAMLELAKRGHKNLLLGGGASSDDNDSLLEFKRKFARNSIVEYSIGGLIINEEVYDELIAIAIEKNPSIKDKRFFLKYRL